MRPRVAFDPDGVFINAPFDLEYEPLFVTMVATISAIGFKPRSVLEVREHGDGRLARIYDLMKACRASVHDLSRMASPPRFNMPFELGLACALKIEEPDRYEVIVFEAKRFRADRSLSDYKGHDVAIHRGTNDGMLSAVLETFRSDVDAAVLRKVAREVRQSAEAMKRDLRSRTIFHPHLFARLVTLCGGVARDFGLVVP